MYKRVLWVEDFNGGQDKDTLKRTFIDASKLKKNEIEWAESFEELLKNIDEDNIFDTIILDVDFPIKNIDKTKDKVKNYITENVFQELKNANKSEPNTAGYIASLYILRSKAFDPDRICFLSAYVPNESDDIQDRLEELISNLNENEYINFCDDLNAKYSKITGEDEAPFKYWGDGDNDLHSKDEVEKYLQSDEFKSLLAILSNRQSNNTQHTQKDDEKTNFDKFKTRFEATGMKFLKWYSKSEQSNDKFSKFVNTNSDYFRFRFAVINMCYLLIDWISSTENSNQGNNKIVNSQIFRNENKYSIEDFRSMLANIASHLKENVAIRNGDNSVYKYIVITLTLYAEDLKYSKGSDIRNLYPLQRVIKALRNGLQHNSPCFDSSWDMSFCAFVIGISFRLYFNINDASFNNKKEYKQMEEIILEIISKNSLLPSTTKIKEIANLVINNPSADRAPNNAQDAQDKIPAYNKLTTASKSKYDIYDLYVLCSYYDEFSFDKDKKTTKNDPERNTIFNKNTKYNEDCIEVKYLRRITKYT